MTTYYDETFGRRVCRLRLEHGMTQERLADIANVSAQAVSKWENGQSYPDILLLPLLAKTFGVTVDELLGIGGEELPTVDEQMDELPSEPVREREGGPELVSIPDVDADADGQSVAEGKATHIRLRITKDKKEAVNLSLPLAAARLLANVTNYFPDRLVEGVEVADLVRGALGAQRGTLVDVDDGNDRVLITLE